MKRTVAALSIVALVAVACGRTSTPPPIQPIPAQPPQPPASAIATREPALPPNEVLRRIHQGGEVFALRTSSCESLVVAAGKTPEERALEIDTSEIIRCSAKRKTGIVLDVTDPQHIECMGARQTAGRVSVVIGCPIEQPRETATPRTNEAIIAGVRLFADRAACEAMIARETMAHEPTCFETEFARAVEQRQDEAPKGDFVTRFETFIDDPSSSWHVKRTDTGFVFFRDRTEKKITTVHSEASFTYDARCKRVTTGFRSTSWTTPGSGGRTSSTASSYSASLAPAEHEDGLPITGDWFYTRRGRERSPRI